MAHTSRPKPPQLKTVKTLAEIPGIHERAAEGLKRALEAQYGVRLRLVVDEAQEED